MRNLFSILALLAANIVLYAQLPSYVPANGLVGWWPFNGNANDESGNGNNGVVNGAALTPDRFGISNNSFEFDGLNDRIDVAQNLIGLNPNSYTISCWFKSNVVQLSQGNNPVIISDRGTSWGYKYTINRNVSDQNVSGSVYYGGPGIGQGAITPVSNTDLDWHSVILTYDQTANTMSIFLDGLVSQVVSNISQWPNNLSSTTIGAYNGPGGFGYTGHWNGLIDDIGVWSRALTNSEILDLYNAPPPICISPAAVSFSGLQASYTTSDGPSSLTGTPAGGVFIGPGITGGAFSPAMAGEGTHGIIYTYVDGNGCVNSYSLCTTVGIGMGLEQGGSALSGVRVYPNPNRGHFNVELELVGLVGMQVFDMRGSLVHNEVFSASGSRTQRALDLSTFAKGNYMLVVEHGGQRVTQMVVVE